MSTDTEYSPQSLDYTTKRSSHGLFPPTLNIYSPFRLEHNASPTPTLSTSSLKGCLVLKLGESPSSLLYDATLSSHWSASTSKPVLVLRSTHIALAEDTCLAAITPKGYFSKTFDITLPQQGGLSVELRMHLGLKQTTYLFEVPVAQSQQHIRYEWFQSPNVDIDTSECQKWGWELIREGTDIVAVWANNDIPSMTEAARFQFRGSSVMEQHNHIWEIAAVMSALRIWQVNWDRFNPRAELRR